MLVQLGFVHAESQSGVTHGSLDVVITRDFNGIFGFHGFCSCIGVFQCPAFFEGRDVILVGRDFAFQRFQLEYVYGVIVVDTACHIDDTAIVRCDIRISYFIVRAAYGYNACSGFDCFIAEVCFSVYRFFGKGVASDSNTVFIIGTRTGTESYAAFFVHNGIRTNRRCEFRTGIRPMADRCRFFFKRTRLHAQCRAVVSFRHRRDTDRRRIAVMRLRACAQCGRLITECARVKADCHGFFLRSFVCFRLCIIVNRFIRVSRFPFIRRFRHGRCVVRSCLTHIGTLTDGNAATARCTYRAVYSYCNSAVRQRFCFRTDADATLSSCFRLRSQCKCLVFRYARLIPDRRAEIIRFHLCFCTDGNIPTAIYFTV